MVGPLDEGTKMFFKRRLFVTYDADMSRISFGLNRRLVRIGEISYHEIEMERGRPTEAVLKPKMGFVPKLVCSPGKNNTFSIPIDH